MSRYMVSRPRRSAKGTVEEIATQLMLGKTFDPGRRSQLEIVREICSRMQWRALEIKIHAYFKEENRHGGGWYE